MKRKTKRRFIGLVGIFGVLIAISSPIALHIFQEQVRNTSYETIFWTLLFWLTFLVIIIFISWLLLPIYQNFRAAEPKYFQEIDFKKPDNDTKAKAIEGILNMESVQPFYVHVAPSSNEITDVCSRLKETRYVTIYGRPGEGKSMLAYHSAYRIREENIYTACPFLFRERYSSYRMKVELLEDKRVESVINNFLFQLDILSGEHKIIIIDDAHKLTDKQHFEEILQQEANEKNGTYIWVETSFDLFKQKEPESDKFIQIDFQSLLEILLSYFYANPMLQQTLAGRILGLDDAIERAEKGKILDAWHFAFVASRGEKRLSEEIQRLDGLELLILFLISAYAVISGESELAIDFVLKKLNAFRSEFGWLDERLRESTPKNVIESLYLQTKDHKSMIRIYDKNKRDRGYIASLHYNFARAVIRASVLRTNLVENLMSVAESLLTSEYHNCRYINVLLYDMGAHSESFAQHNKNWLIDFANNIQPQWLLLFARLLQYLKRINEKMFREIIGQVNVDGIAKKAKDIEAGQFQQLAELLKVLDRYRYELIRHKEFNFEQLVRKANCADVDQWGQLADLLNALGDLKDEIIDNLKIEKLAKKVTNVDVKKLGQLELLLNALGEEHRKKMIECKEFDLEGLAKQVSAAEVKQFQQLAQLLNALGEHKNKLLEKLDYNSLAKTANNIDPSNSILLKGLTLFTAQLQEHRNDFVPSVHWSSISMSCPINNQSLPVLGACLNNLLQQSHIFPESTGVDDVNKHLKTKKTVIKETVDNTNYHNYLGLADFLWNFNKISHELALEIVDRNTILKLTEGYKIDPRNYLAVSRLINSLDSINPPLSILFIKEIIMRIKQSINEDSWEDTNKEELKYLIKSIYKSVPDIWREMVDSAIVVDLSTIDLNSIYTEVDKGRNMDD